MAMAIFHIKAGMKFGQWFQAAGRNAWGMAKMPVFRAASAIVRVAGRLTPVPPALRKQGTGRHLGTGDGKSNT